MILLQLQYVHEWIIIIILKKIELIVSTKQKSLGIQA
jgi:hypothetical protein